MVEEELLAKDKALKETCKDDLGILQELFVDEIREFNEEHGANE